MKILVCGGREWNNYTKIYTELQELPVDSILIHGACRGADRLAGDIGNSIGFTVVEYPANWNTHGRAAGPLRNQKMIDDEGPFDLVLAFHENIDHSKGTKDMVNRCLKKGYRVKIIS